MRVQVGCTPMRGIPAQHHEMTRNVGESQPLLRFSSKERRRPTPALRTGASGAQAAAGLQGSRAAGQHAPRSPPPPSRRRARAPARRRWAGRAGGGRATGRPGALLGRRARSASGTATHARAGTHDSPNQVGAGYSPYLLGICGHGAAATLMGAPHDPRAHWAQRASIAGKHGAPTDPAQWHRPYARAGAPRRALRRSPRHLRRRTRPWQQQQSLGLRRWYARACGLCAARPPSWDSDGRQQRGLPRIGLT
eukprot:COSAG01_NODE_12440_length_1739_cov_2.027439_2_plen_251_part_00